jgi:hypothetical protein
MLRTLFLILLTGTLTAPVQAAPTKQVVQVSGDSILGQLRQKVARSKDVEAEACAQGNTLFYRLNIQKMSLLNTLPDSQLKL